MYDIVANIGNSVIQHGKYNDRIYLMKLSSCDFPGIIDELSKLAQTNGYSKIFAKIPPYAKDGFIRDGFIVEASIPKFYNNCHTAFFMAKFFTELRGQNKESAETEKVLEAAQRRSTERKATELAPGFIYRMCGLPDAPQMAEVYKSVFATYPFPIYDPGYIVRTLNQNFLYFAIWHQGKIVALSSAEVDIDSGNAEMTDFATLPEYRGEGFSVFLLQLMEFEVRKRQIKTAYSIASALSVGMNITFAKSGYNYSGTLVNNTNISGRLESMNVWYKSLR